MTKAKVLTSERVIVKARFTVAPVRWVDDGTWYNVNCRYRYNVVEVACFRNRENANALRDRLNDSIIGSVI